MINGKSKWPVAGPPRVSVTTSFPPGVRSFAMFCKAAGISSNVCNAYKDNILKVIQCSRMPSAHALAVSVIEELTFRI